MTPEKIDQWFDRFRFYRHSPSREQIGAWLNRFAEKDKPFASILLDNVQLMSEADILRGYREALEAVPGWNRKKSKRKGKWVFAGFGDAGESGAEMLRKFREANNLASQRFDYLFSSPTELPSKQLSGEDTVVFVDDFSGTGDQISKFWGKHAEFAAGARAFLVLTAATQNAINRIVEMEYLHELLVSRVLGTEDDIFAGACTLISDEEKKRLLGYCKKADKSKPKGFGECGLLFVLSHKTPNNSIPILHANKRSWVGLFPRYIHA